MNFKRVNNITGWVVCLIACTVYILTSEAGGSLWDCGEFVSSCFKVQIPHPPGAPLFVLIGRFFIILFGDNPMTAAKAVNIMSALASGFTILFLFWTITHFARRIVHKNTEVPLTGTQIWGIMAAGVVGALCYTFSDSFWYSAVEGEVYALSSFFTALVFWAILKWEHEADQPHADRWIVFIFFMMGLSIGVHLLGLLTIPAIVAVYYFRKRPAFNYPVIRKYFIWVVAIGGVLAFFGAMLANRGDQNVLNDMLPQLQNAFGDDVQIKDSTLSGLMLLGTLAVIGLLYLIEALNKDKKEYYGGAYIFTVIGFIITGIVQVVIIQLSIKVAGHFDIFFVNSMGLPFFSGFTIFFILVAVGIWLGLRYAAKKHWGFLRLGLWCTAFMFLGYSSYLTTMIRSSANPAVDMFNVDNPMSLVGYLGRDQYGDWPILYGQKFTAQPVQYRETSMRYQKSTTGKDKYIETGKDVKPVYLPQDKMVFPRMWDASNDQGHADYYASFMGASKLQDGTYSRTPDFGDNLKFFISYQNYFMYLRYFLWNFSGKQNDIEGTYAGNKRDGNWITGINFIDSMIYGNQSLLPDSIKNSKGHNTLFALPLILGLIGLFYHFKRRGDDAFVTLLLFFLTGFAIIIYLNQPGNQPRERDYAYVGSFYAFAIWVGIGVLQIIEWLSKKMNQRTATILAFAVCMLAVPVLMAQQEWDDHDRSRKELARDIAKDYLESCAPNAILFTFGDNDTYPLWYAQEVEGIRPDIRVINTSLLGIDWYINQLRYKVNQSAPIDVIWTPQQIEGKNRDIAIYKQAAGYDANQYYNLYDVMKNYVGNDANVEERGYNIFPTHKVFVPVDVNTVKSNGTVNPTDTVVSQLQFEIQKGAIYKGDLAMLNIIAANNWQRPIYFTMPYDDLGFGNYIRRDGLSYRLVPVVNSPINTDWMFNVVMNKFGYGNANIFNVYFDEENRRHLNIIRDADTQLALDLVDKNRKEDARKVLERTDKMMLSSNFPYGMVSRNNMHNYYSLMFLKACYLAEDPKLAAKVNKDLKTDLQQQIKYYNALTGIDAENMERDLQASQMLLQQLEQMEQQFGGNKNPAIPEGGALNLQDTQVMPQPTDTPTHKMVK
ncbi:DUF2723 domain-containing protein [Ilyomonas limi]|uniref:DUF2723 domain-containing protein n=1 Tax=Ilyomonas limi TaxID=2575867 RepID=UPI001F0D7B6F|nr:DUF2723 domain-containing protein [Ilyomonas limi]